MKLTRKLPSEAAVEFTGKLLEVPTELTWKAPTRVVLSSLESSFPGSCLQLIPLTLVEGHLHGVSCSRMAKHHRNKKEGKIHLQLEEKPLPASVPLLPSTDKI